MIRPPWALEEAHFAATCTRGGACVRACPERILVAGRGGFPEVDFAAGACSFCGDCARACPSGAIDAGRAAAGEPAWDVVAAIDEKCLALNGVACRTCGEACDAGAIRFRPVPGGVAQPEFDPERCDGCGACFAPCPGAAIEMVHRSRIV